MGILFNNADRGLTSAYGKIALVNIGNKTGNVDKPEERPVTIRLAVFTEKGKPVALYTYDYLHNLDFATITADNPLYKALYDYVKTKVDFVSDLV